MMDRFYKMMKRDNKGFTLVELMVVLLILGILVAIAVPIYNNTQANAKLKACQANLRTIDGAVAQYAAAEGKDPATVEVSKDDWDSTEKNPLLKGKYLKKAPTCPSEGDYSVLDGNAQCSKSAAPDNHSY